MVAANIRGKKKMMIAKEVSKKVVAKRRERKLRDLAPEIGANKVEYWGIEKKLVQKMELKRATPT